MDSDSDPDLNTPEKLTASPSKIIILEDVTGIISSPSPNLSEIKRNINIPEPTPPTPKKICIIHNETMATLIEADTWATQM